MGTVPQGDYDPATAELIRIKVNQMFGNERSFTREDREDQEQDAWIHVIVGMKRFDPKRASRSTFADRIVKSKLNTALEKHGAQKRDRRRVSSLRAEEIEIAGENGQQSTDDRIDVQAAMDRMPAELRAIAILFQTFTEAEIIRRTGVSRQKVRGMRSRIAAYLRDPNCDQN